MNEKKSHRNYMLDSVYDFTFNCKRNLLNIFTEKNA